MKKRFSLIFFTVFVLSLFSCNHAPEITKYKVTYVSTYGEVQEPIEVEENTILYGEQLAELLYEHGTFLGWYIGDTKIEAGTFSVTEDVTLTAKWQIDSCFVTFMPGLGIGNNYVKEVDFNTPIAIPENTFNAQTGYKFAGWAKNEEQVVSYNSGDSFTVTEDVSFTAIWIEKDAYSIIYHNLKDGDVVAGEKTNPASYKENQIVRLYSVERTGYIFEGWFENEDFSGNAISGWGENLKTDNIDLYPKFTPIKYKVTFNLNGANGSVDDIVCTYDEVFSIPNCPFSIPTYTFSCWILNGVEYKVNDSIKNLSSKEGDVIELVAKWVDLYPPAPPKQCTTLRIEDNNIQIQCFTPSDSDLSKIRVNIYEGEELSDYQDFEINTEDINNVQIKQNTLITLQVKGKNGLKQMTDYTFEVLALDENGNQSTDNKKVTATTRTKKMSPLMLNIDSTSTSLKLNWTYPDNFRTYKNTTLKVINRTNNYTMFEKTYDNTNTTSYSNNSIGYGNEIIVQFSINEYEDSTGYCGGMQVYESIDSGTVDNFSLSKRYPTYVELSWYKKHNFLNSYRIVLCKMNNNIVDYENPIEVSVNHSSDGQQKAIVSNLEPETKYKVFLIAELSNGHKFFKIYEIETALPDGLFDFGYIVYEINNKYYCYSFVDDDIKQYAKGVVLATTEDKKQPTICVDVEEFMDTWLKYDKSQYAFLKISPDLQTYSDDGRKNISLIEPYISGMNPDGTDFYRAKIQKGYYIPAIDEWKILVPGGKLESINNVLENLGKPKIEINNTTNPEDWGNIYISSTLGDKNSWNEFSTFWMFKPSLPYNSAAHPYDYTGKDKVIADWDLRRTDSGKPDRYKYRFFFNLENESIEN